MPSGHAMGVERVSERELKVSRVILGPVHLVYRAWSQPELFQKWWVPKSFGLNLLACEMDVRVGGKYRLVFPHEDSTMEFFGTYLEVVPDSKLVWTNDERPEGQTISTVTFSDLGGKTLVEVCDLYPTEEALLSGSMDAMPEALTQLEELLVAR